MLARRPTFSQMIKTQHDEMTNKTKIPPLHVPPTENILKEIAKETNLIKSINGAIAELEETAENLEQKIINSDTGNDKRANRWREKYHSQVRVNEHLEKERSQLKDDMEKERIKITNGWSRYPHLYDFSEDMSESELQRLIRQLEMVRHNLEGELRDIQWRLDQESTNYHQLNELCHMYKLEISTAKANVMKRSQIQYVDEHVYTLPGMMAGSIQRHLHPRTLPSINGHEAKIDLFIKHVTEDLDDEKDTSTND